MKLLIDMDEVLAKFSDRIVQYWNEDHPDQARKMEEITDWDLASSLGAGGRDFLRSMMRYNHLYEYLDPVDGCIEGMHQLLVDGHNVKIVTSIPMSATTAYDGKVQWIRKHMPFFPLKSFYAVHEKFEVRGDLLLDDGLHNLTPFRQVGGKAVAFARPWNTGWDGLRVEDWPQFLRMVRMLDPHQTRTYL